MDIFWVILAIIILAIGYTFYRVMRSDGSQRIKKEQVSINVYVSECGEVVEYTVKSLIDICQNNHRLGFSPSLKLLLDNTTEEQRRICKLLEGDYEFVTCGYIHKSE